MSKSTAHPILGGPCGTTREHNAQETQDARNKFKSRNPKPETSPNFKIRMSNEIQMTNAKLQVKDTAIHHPFAALFSSLGSVLSAQSSKLCFPFELLALFFPVPRTQHVEPGLPFQL